MASDSQSSDNTNQNQDRTSEDANDVFAADLAQDNPTSQNLSPQVKSRNFRLVIVTAVSTAALATIFYYAWLRPHALNERAKQEKELAVLEVYFHDLPPVLVNLRKLDGERETMLKASFRLEVEHKTDLELLKIMAPRIKDDMLIYLRDLTLDDLSNEDSLRRMKEELKARANSIATPVVVKAVLIKDMIMQ